MHVQVDDRDAGHGAFLSQHLDRYRDVVEQTEALAVVRKAMVEPATDVDGDGVCRGQTRGGQGPAGHEPKALDDRLVQRELQLAELFRRKGERPDLVEILVGVHQRKLVPGRRFRFDGAVQVCVRCREQPRVDAPVLLGQINVGSDVDRVARGIDEFH